MANTWGRSSSMDGSAKSAVEDGIVERVVEHDDAVFTLVKRELLLMIDFDRSTD